MFDKLKHSELEELFSLYCNEAVSSFTANSNKSIIFENQLKILHYVLASQLLDAFTETFGIKAVKRLNSNDNYAFSKNVLGIINHAVNPFVFDKTDIENNVHYDYIFKQDQYLQAIYDYLYSDRIKTTQYYSSDEPHVSSGFFILSELKEHIVSTTGAKIDSLVFSNIIDILIDKGFIIPTIIHTNDGCIVRGYKCGEVYKLNQEHFQLFGVALQHYLNKIKRDWLQKTEFEKLCVLFFREAAKDNIITYRESTGDEDEYSICYSKFGPRISTSKPIYSANKTSTLASKLLTLEYIEEIDSGEQNQIKKAKMGYRIKFDMDNNILDHLWIDCAKNFAVKFALIHRELFTVANNDGTIVNGNNILFDKIRDMHIKSYLEFLTMLSIGSSKKAQLLSLLAEIYLAASIEIGGSITTTLKHYMRVLDGLVSGMWKYMCYSETTHPIKKAYDKLESLEGKEYLRNYISSSFILNMDSDQNEEIKEMIEDAGKLIFSIVYSVWFLLKKYSLLYFENDELIDLAANRPREFYYDKLKDIRASIHDGIATSKLEEDLLLLQRFRVAAQDMLNQYNVRVAKTVMRDSKSSENAPTTIIINGSPNQVNSFNNGGLQVNGN